MNDEKELTDHEAHKPDTNSVRAEHLALFHLLGLDQGETGSASGLRDDADPGYMFTLSHHTRTR